MQNQRGSRSWVCVSVSFSGRIVRRSPFRCGDCGVVRSLVLEFQAELRGLSEHDERTRRQVGAHDDSAMGAALHAGLREAVPAVRPPGGRLLGRHSLHLA